jgi:DNA-directed RNA polymerase specialized sigma24 family protein
VIEHAGSGPRIREITRPLDDRLGAVQPHALELLATGVRAEAACGGRSERDDGRLTTIPEQLDNLHLQDLQSALAMLSPEQREVILLVGAEGLSYEETAIICGCAVGTIKSRVNRARARLIELTGLAETEESRNSTDSHC